MTDTLTILHLNDVYNIEPQQQEPVGGASRLATLFEKFKHENPLVLFSGDAFNPSIGIIHFAVSTVERGHQMAPILKSLNVQCAVLGNHEFDFGVDELMDICKESGFPWLMSNVIDNFTNLPLGGVETYHIIHHSGKKLGFVGLVEEDWISALPTVDHEDVTYTDYVTVATQLSEQLKNMHKVDVVIALTHMRWSSDIRLAECVPGIQLILGGHDHDYGIQQVNGTFIIKSGSDFQTASKVDITFRENQSFDVNITKLVADGSVEEHPQVKQLVSSFTDKVSEKLDIVIGIIEEDLDGRFSMIRTSETNLGNFVGDVLLTVVEADMVIINSGTFRSNMVHKKGPFRLYDLKKMLPMYDILTILLVKGEEIIEALENGVSKYPGCDGRFPQLSGATFAFDPSKPPGQRVLQQYVKIRNAPIDKNRVYRVAMKQYLADGKDGYTMFKSCQRLLPDGDVGPVLPTVVQNHFTSIKIVQGNMKCKSSHRQSVINLLERGFVIKKSNLTQRPTSEDFLVKRNFQLERQRSVLGTELHHCRVAPRVEGRIIIVDNEQVLRDLEENNKAKAESPVIVFKQEVERQTSRSNSAETNTHFQD